MSDLISRSALLQKFNDTGIQITFNLPVKEILGEDVDIDDFVILVQDAIQIYKNMVIGTIKDMPTAYDVEKVVEELEEKQQKWKTKLSESDTNYMDNAILKQYISHYDIAIEIVRKGGI